MVPGARVHDGHSRYNSGKGENEKWCFPGGCSDEGGRAQARKKTDKIAVESQRTQAEGEPLALVRPRGGGESAAAGWESRTRDSSRSHRSLACGFGEARFSGLQVPW